MRRVWAVIGALALVVTVAPVAHTGASFTAQAVSPGGTTTTAVLPPPAVAAESSAMGLAQLSWDEPTIRPEVASTFTVERTIDGQTTAIDVGDGLTGDGMTVPPLGLGATPVTQISANLSSCAIAGGEVYCWGGSLFMSGPDAENVWTPMRMLGELEGHVATRVSVGPHHACAVADGAAYCWGNNTLGRLGDGTMTSRLAPAKVGGALAGKVVTDISAGASGTCAVADSRAYCWGDGGLGQLGDGLGQWSLVPVAVRGALEDTDVTSIATGSATSCAVVEGAAYCWGWNAAGQLGDDTRVNRMMPVAVSTEGVLGGLVVTQVAVAERHSCALAAARVFCWGENVYGRLGDGTVASSDVPVAVDTSGVLAGREVTAVTLGSRYGCALAGGRPFCWGANSSGERGDGAATGDRLAPVAVTAISGTVTDFTAGGFHACAVVSGVASCWGSGSAGRLGDGTTSGSLTARAVDTSDALALAECEPGWRPLRDPFRCGAPPGSGVPGLVDDLRVPRSLKSVTQLSAGDAHSCAVADGTAVCWGQNFAGQLGDGSVEVRLTPVQVSGMLSTRTVTQVSVSARHSCAIADARAYCWGEGFDGQLGGGRSERRSTPTPVSSVIGGKTVTDISAGYSHSCAVGDGVAYCWGSREDGQLGDGSTNHYAVMPIPVGGELSGLTVTRVTAARGISCAIAHPPAAPLETTVYCWGSGAEGRLGNGDTVSSAIPVAVAMNGALSGRTVTEIAAASDSDGSNATVCVIADGDPFCWGSGTAGQLGDGRATNSSVPVAVQSGGAIVPGTTTRIALGHRTACAVAAGTPVCWGLRADSAVPAAVDASGALSGTVTSDIDFGDRHGCVVADARAHCWSVGASFELGIGGPAHDSPPVAVDTSGALSSCATGWLPAMLGAGQCAPGEGIEVGYRVSYQKAGWSSPDTVVISAWRGPAS
jgi:alpha-tubulin suppressor-like RCC1 family protein